MIRIAKKTVRSALLQSPRLYDALTSQRRYRLYYRLGLVHERDFKALPLLTEDPRPLVLDVGGNNGQSILSIKRVLPDARIITFEPNLAHLHDLQRLAARFGGVEVMPFGLGETGGEFDLHWPVYNGKHMLGLASLDEREARTWLNERTVYRFDVTRLAVERIVCPVKTLDSLSLNPQVIKIDTQGTEMSVVAGGIETIARTKPVVMVEGLTSGHEIVAALTPSGYEPFRFTRGRLEAGFGRPNTFLIPRNDHAAASL